MATMPKSTVGQACAILGKGDYQGLWGDLVEFPRGLFGLLLEAGGAFVVAVRILHAETFDDPGRKDLFERTR